MQQFDLRVLVQATFISLFSLFFPLSVVQASLPPTLSPSLFHPPQQQSLPNADPVVIATSTKNIQVMPVYSFSLSGLVVGSRQYEDWQGQDLGGLIPRDLCLIWGGNAQNFPLSSWQAAFSQSQRRCTFINRSHKAFSIAEFTNIHPIAASAEVKRTLEQVKPGDQITLRGKLVDVQVIDRTTGLPVSFLKTSTSRLDKGDGACEIVWVESVSIDQEASVLTRLSMSQLRYP